MITTYQNPLVHYIPAQPGWAVVTLVDSDVYCEETAGIDCLWVEDILFWRVITEVRIPDFRHDQGEKIVSTFTLPVTVHTAYDYGDQYAIRKPDGTCAIPEDSDYSNGDLLLNEWRERARRRRKIDRIVEQVQKNQTNEDTHG